MEEGLLPIAVCVFPDPPPNRARTVSYPGLVRETLHYHGIPFLEVSAQQIERVLPNVRVLLTVGECAPDIMPDLRPWLQAGHVWISLSGTAGMPELLGVESVPPAFASWGGGLGMLGEGWLHVIEDHAILSHLRVPLHFFNGARVCAAGGARVLAVAEGRGASESAAPAIVLTQHGNGHSLFIAPDVTGTLVRIRQGIPVLHDGVPAPDGTAPICDGVLKSDDGSVLDWERDRQPLASAPGLRAFLEPIADQWEDLIVRAVLWAACEAGCRLPTLWLYPRNLPALAVLSHDSDGNDAGKARSLLRVLEECGIRSTWCIQPPGYEDDVVDVLRAAGHELGLHYDAMTEGLAWSAEEFARQCHAIRALVKQDVRTNKNHYLRWEGDGELWEWCLNQRIRVDQSKGASKTGEAGFNFGTCRLYRPVRRDGTVMDVWEMPTPTQDLVVFAPPALGGALRAAVLRSSGILHHLFHPAHIETPGVAEALRQVVTKARAAGLEWWTAAEVADWFDARMGCRWVVVRDGLRPHYRLKSPSALPGATIRWLDPNGEVEHMGLRFHAEVMDLAAGENTVSEAEEERDE